MSKDRASPPRLLATVIFLRHGIRAPLPGEALPAGRANVWASWATPPDMLTPNGYRNARSLGRWFGAEWRRRGLLKGRCPEPTTILIHTNILPRTIDSGKAFAEGLAPHCALPLMYNADGRPDPIFDAIASGAASFDPVAAMAAEHQTSETLLAPLSGEIDTAQQILGCPPKISPCGIYAASSGPITANAGGVHVDGRAAAAAGVGQALMLQFAEGRAMPAWRGQPIGTGNVERLLALHTAPLLVQARAPYPAARIAAPFLAELRQHFASQSRAPAIRVYVGHDSNISAITARLGIIFKASGYPQNEPPIGAAFGFELLAYPGGERRVRAFYVAQTPSQLRRLSPLIGKDQPWRAYYAITGCDAGATRGCPLSRFLAIIDALSVG